VNNELERMWKEAVMEVLRKAKKNLRIAYFCTTI
jgi:hypothetical protein